MNTTLETMPGNNPSAYALAENEPLPLFVAPALSAIEAAQVEQRLAEFVPPSPELEYNRLGSALSTLIGIDLISGCHKAMLQLAVWEAASQQALTGNKGVAA